MDAYYTSFEEELIMSPPRLSTEEVVLSDDQFRIIFNFSCKPKSRITWIFEDSFEEVELESPCILKSMQFDIEKTPMDPAKTGDRMIEGLDDFPLSPLERAELVSKAVATAWHFLVTSMPLGHNQLNLHLDFTAFSHGVHDLHTINTNTMGAAGDDHNKQVPATDVSIKSLESKTVEYSHCSENGCCAICLEDFESGNCVVQMPCCHYFHGDCIKRWLRRSHNCPLCRFEMPTY